ncbi:MAG: hypothetical protein KTR16_08520 [Acidiferrobacterales bacterium]|nr:hypothetical protein [Acidiferrobacterales bacterium]
MNKQFIKEESLLNDSYRLGVQIYNSGFVPTFVVGMWRGGSAVGIYVQECLQYLGIKTDHIAIRTSYRGLTHYQSMLQNPKDNIRVHGTQYLLENLNVDDKLLLVDDVCGSGQTLEVVLRRLQSRLKRNMPREVKIAALWNKPSKRYTNISPDFYIHETDDWLVLPYELNGLTAEEIAREKPIISELINR